MKKFLKFAYFALLFSALCTHAYAIVKEKTPTLAGSHRLSATSFIDYPPFGSLSYSPPINTIFQPMVDAIMKYTPHQVEFLRDGTYPQLVFGVINGHIDILLGAYYDTERYNGIKLLYPSILNNPLVVVTMPESNFKITNKNDLKPLRGAVDDREYLADYVTKELKSYNIQHFNDSDKLYEQLFIGNIDYILTSRYYGALEQAKLGIRNMVLMSKTSVFDMPMFIGVSGVARKEQPIGNTIQIVLKKHVEEIKQQIEEKIIQVIHDADEASVGVVPPAYVK